METLVGMDDKVEDAVGALCELQGRLDRERNKLAEARQRQDDLRDKRLDAAIPYDTVDQQEAIGLSHEISDGEDIVADLEARILERQHDVQHLTKEKARNDANGMVGEAMVGYEDVIAAFDNPFALAERWLKQANEAASSYSRCNPGFAGRNMKLAPKIEVIAGLMTQISFGRTI